MDCRGGVTVTVFDSGDFDSIASKACKTLENQQDTHHVDGLNVMNVSSWPGWAESVIPAGYTPIPAMCSTVIIAS